MISIKILSTLSGTGNYARAQFFWVNSGMRILMPVTPVYCLTPRILCRTEDKTSPFNLLGWESAKTWLHPSHFLLHISTTTSRFTTTSPEVDQFLRADEYFDQLELRTISRKASFNSDFGISLLQGDLAIRNFPSTSSDLRVNGDTALYNSYLYGSYKGLKHVSLRLGVSADYLDDPTLRTRSQVNPKFGLMWQIAKNTTLSSEGQLSERYSSPLRSGAPSNPQSSPDSINFLTTSSGPILGATALGLTMPLTLRCLWALSIRSEIPTYHREVGEKLTR
jgi:hypothetical protein